MSLFSRLLSLHSSPRPVEDFFTEVVAGLFTAAPTLCAAWFVDLGLVEPVRDRERGVFVSTQRRLDHLHDHDLGSRLDMVVECSSGAEAERDVIFLESKIDSGEGPEQLRRYADLLSGVEGARSRTLVYITRDYDPKDEAEILRVSENAGDESGSAGGATQAPVRFVQLRWGDLYRFLREAVDRERAWGEAEWVLDPGLKAFVGEVMSFMEELGMAQRNMFTAEDLMVMSRLQHTITLMEETLRGQVAEALSTFTAAKVGGQSITLRDFSWRVNRYVLHSLLVRNHQWWCAAGFSLPAHDVAGGYPSVSVWLEVSPDADHRREILAAMRRWAERDGWEGSGLEHDEGAWSRISRSRGLQHFLSGEDHVSGIRTFLVESLEELSEMKREFPELPWPGR